MAQGDNPPGLLSKVAKFVRNPSKDWTDSLQQGSEPDNGYNKQALKEMIERKRLNDAVRKREFDHLRKLRRADTQDRSEQGGRPSFFHSSLNHDERAKTLKKIDEIEAQMSRQWWKGRIDSPATTPDLFPPTAPMVLSSQSQPEHASAPRKTDVPSLAQLPVTQAPGSDMLSLRFPLDAPPTQPANFDGGSSDISASHDSQADSDFPTTVQSDSRTNPRMLDDLVTSGATRPTEAPATQTLSQFGALEEGTAESFRGWRRTLQPATTRALEGAGFSSQRLFTVAGTDTQTDPDLEDAAIRFANGDDAGAEEGLLLALKGSSRTSILTEGWMAALFDLYRATGQQVKFDRVALEFADRFGRSAPVWFSTPELLGKKAQPSLSKPMKVTAKSAVPNWVCPELVTLQDLDNLKALLVTKANSRVLLDWHALQGIEPEAIASMSELFTHWGTVPLMLVFRGHENLERVLKHMTPPADPNVPAAVWQLRMDVLRLLNKSDEFELVALEYCVTYEVSPPSWQKVQCTCELEGLSDRVQPDAGPTTVWAESRLTTGSPLSKSPSFADDQPSGEVDLSGEILGDAAEALARLDEAAQGKLRLVVHCARLIRVDFTAAGGLLNWVAQQQSRGAEVQFKDLNHMVAAFFRVIGIHEHAQVQARNA